MRRQPMFFVFLLLGGAGMFLGQLVSQWWVASAPFHWALRVTVAGWPVLLFIALTGRLLEAIGERWGRHLTCLGMGHTPLATQVTFAVAWVLGIWLVLLDWWLWHTRAGRRARAWARGKRRHLMAAYDRGRLR